MPLRVESITQDKEGATVTTIREKIGGFTVGPGGATQILGVQRTRLLELDAPDIFQEDSKGRRKRVYTDLILLRLAYQIGQELGKVGISRDIMSGMVEIISARCKTLLGIDYDDLTKPQIIGPTLLQTSAAYHPKPVHSN